ncbi:MAG: leucine-rich repeat protein [Oscillospiraceae bacterium]|nr:leucine-rich repeat protein [Oscillospiraceae bacterium]
MAKRIMCIIISVLMIVSLLPTGAFADSGDDTGGIVEVTASSSGDADSGETTDEDSSSESDGEEVVEEFTVEGETVSVEAALTGTEDSVASIGDTTYATLAAAVAGVSTDGTQTTITLTADTTESASITVASSQNIVLDLNGKTVDMNSHNLFVEGTLTIQDSTASTSGPTVNSDYSVTYTSGKITSTVTTVYVRKGGTATLASGTVESTTNIAFSAEGDTTGTTSIVSTVNVTGGYAVSVEGAILVKGKGATANISGGVLTASDNAVVAGNGTNSGTTNYGGTSITISGGTLIGHITTSGYVACGIYHPQSGTLTISGGTIYADGGCGILMRGGTLTMTGGTIIATGDSTTTGKVGDSRVVVSDSGIVYDYDSGYYDVANVSVSLSGSVSVTAAASAISVVDTSGSASSTAVTVSGGTYTNSDGSADTSVSSYVADGLTVDESGAVVTDTTTYVAQIGDTKYATLGEAVAAVPVGTDADNLGTATTIKILCDIDDAEGISVPSYVDLTIDFDGHTYILTGPGAGSTNTQTNGFQLLKDSTIVMKNGTIKIAEDATRIYRIIQNYSNLTLEDMQIYSQNQLGGEDYCLSFNYGTITFKGNTSIHSSSSSVIAFDVYYWASAYEAGTTVVFDSSYTGTIDGVILYDTTNADKAHLTINGSGTFVGGISLSSSASSLEEVDISITGGTFGTDVSEYCTSTTTALDLDGDGTYTVVTCWDVSKNSDGSVKAYATVESDGYVTLHIIGTGAMKDYDAASDRPWHADFTTVNGGTTTYSKESVTAVEIEDGVTKIGAYAFSSLMISYAIIPESVTTISANAFSAARPGTGDDGTYLPVIVYMVGDTEYTPNSTTSEGNVILAYLNGGSLDESTIDGGDGNTNLATPTKEGDTFGGWYRNSSFSGTAYTTGEKGKVYYAKWTNESSWDVSEDGDGSVLAYVSLNEDGTVTLHITGTGAMKDFTSNDERPWHSGFTVSGASGTFAKESITNIVIEDGVTHIGALAFCSTKVSSVVIPASVESIGENAFAWVKGYTDDNTNYLTIVYLEGDTDWTLSSGETAYVAQAYLNGTSLPDTMTGTPTLEETTLTGYTVMGWYTDSSASGTAVTTAEAGKTYYACIAVASIGDTYYATLESAVSAANEATDGATVTLLADITLDAQIVITGTVTLDLNSHSVTRNTETNTTAGLILVSSGTFTVQDTSSDASGYIDGATYTLNGSTYVGYGIYITGGTVNVKSGTVAGYRAIYGSAGTLNVSGGTVSGTQIGIMDGGSLSVNISGGTVTATHSCVYMNGGTVKVTGGTIGGTSTSYGVNVQAGTAEISSGTIEGSTAGVIATGGSSVTIGTESSTTGPNITGGYEAVEINTQATATTPSIVKVYSGTLSGTSYGICIYGKNSSTDCYSQLYVYGGTISATTYFGITGNGSTGQGYTTIYIYGGTITSTNGQAIYHPQQNGTLYVYGGTIKGDTGIEVRGGTVIIEDMTEDGSLTIEATGTPTTSDPNYSGSTTSGAAVAIAPYNLSNISVSIVSGTLTGETAVAVVNPNSVTDWNYTTSVEISGGTLTGAITEEIEDVLQISGGTYSTEVNPEYCADGYTPTATTDEETQTTTYGVTEFSLGIYGSESTVKATIVSGEGTNTMYVKVSSANISNYTTEKYPTTSVTYTPTETVDSGSYVFAGWYSASTTTDEDGNTVTNYTALSEFPEDTTAYAKFVDANVLTVRAQVPTDAGSSTTTSMRLISTVDSANYKSVGFEVYIGSNTTKISAISSTVYSTITALGSEYKPTEFSSSSLYFFTCTLKNIPSSGYDTTIKVTPVWTTLDSTTVYGTTREFTVNEILSSYSTGSDS